jgi:hypothetical protein
MNSHRIALERTEAAPHVRVILTGKIVVDTSDHPAPAACFDEADNRDDDGSKPNEEELENFIEDG